MLRKLKSWTGRYRVSQTKRSNARRGRTSPLRDTILGLEWLETRHLLNASPVLSIPAQQFFGDGLSHVPFRAMFTDVAEAPDVVQSFDYTIEWGDGSTTTGNTTEFMAKTPFGQDADANDPIVGRIQEFHTYNLADPTMEHEYTVTVTLTEIADGVTIGSDTLSGLVDVFRSDEQHFIGISGTDSDPVEVNEGDEFSLTVPGSADTNKWRINWGDAIQSYVFEDSPTSLKYTYVDDMDFISGETVHHVSAAVFKDGGIFYAWNVQHKWVHDVKAVPTIAGNLDVNAGAPYTLNLSNVDPGDDPVQGWWVFWEGLANTAAVEVVIGNPSSVTHTYASGGLTHTVLAFAFNDDGVHAESNQIQVTVHDVVLTADAGGPYLAFGDIPIQLEGTGADASGGTNPLTFAWDLDGDGLFGETGVLDALRGDEVGATPLFDPTGLTGTVSVALRVDDGQGHVADDIAEITVLSQGSHLINGTLYVAGSNTASDIMTITQTDGIITVTASDPVNFNASDILEIKVFAGGGHDIVVTSSSIIKPITIDGGAGNDLLVGGSGRSVLIGGAGNDILWGGAGDDVLLGGDGNDDLFGGGGNDALVGGFGNDFLFGGAGRDLLIGSQDEDLLHAGTGEDILIGGHTSHDNDIDALDAIMATWGSTHSFTARVETLTGDGGLLGGDAVFDDDATDIIIGGAGRDLVFGDTNPADGVFDILALNPIQDRLVTI